MKNESDKLGIAEQIRARAPFHRWMRALQLKAKQRSLYHQDPMARKSIDCSLSYTREKRTRIEYCKSSTGSSLKFVSAVWSASTSLSGGSELGAPTEDPIATDLPKYFEYEVNDATMERGSSANENKVTQPPSVDSRMAHRSFKRHQILKELITTEESYVSDMRFLSNVIKVCSVFGALKANQLVGVHHDAGSTSM